MGRRALVPFIVAFALICGGLSSRAAGQTSNEISAGSAALYYLNQARFGQDPTQQALVQFNAIENEARAHATRMARARAISFAGICDPSPSCTDGPDDSIERLWAIDSSLDGWCAVGLKVTVKKKTGYINKGVAKIVSSLQSPSVSFCGLGPSYNIGGIGIDWIVKGAPGRKKVHFYASLIALVDSIPGCCTP